MELLSLNGPWTLDGPESYAALSAAVPGCVHLDLISAGLLPDLNFRDNEKAQLFIGETDWRYHRQFDATEALLAHERVILRCHGLDTLATLRINDMIIGFADNMFRIWEFDVKPYLRPGSNQVEVYFAAPMPYLRQREADMGVMYAWSVGDHRLNSGGWLRKEPCNFGWDWGPRTVTSGIWRDIELITFDEARLTDVRIDQDHQEAGRVRLTVSGGIERASGAALAVEIVVQHDGQTITQAAAPVEGDSWAATMTIENAKLWWVNGLGAQPLYTVRVRLLNAAAVIDTQDKRIGLRTLTLDRLPDEWGESFQFSINGVPFFAKGADWIPADPFVACVGRDQFAPLLQAAAAVHMNMLRAWGGGVYEADAFFDLCDELGIAVWQDFMFACGHYPAFDEAFMDNVRHEAIDNVRRLRHHPSLALWCGNNELEQGLVGTTRDATHMSWAEYGWLFDELLPIVVSEHDPGRPYWPSSPHTPIGDRNNFMSPASGDAHLWGVWHGRDPVESYRGTFHRFVSEFGFQSWPEPHVVAAYTEPDDRNITSYVMEYHQRSGIGNATILHYLLAWFRLPTSFEATLWMSQILQGEIIKYAVEHWRRQRPRTMGALYWQLNDLWPAPTWSSLDYQGRWKALHYAARRFYAPLLVTGVEDSTRGTVSVHLSSDRLEAVEGVLEWSVMTTAGRLLAQESTPVIIAPNQSAEEMVLECAPYLEATGERQLLVWLGLRVNGERVSENLVTFTRPKHLELTSPVIALSVKPCSGDEWDVTLTADRPALWVWLEHPQGPIHASDNFFHLRPDEARHLVVRGTAGLNPDLLTVHSIVDTWA